MKNKITLSELNQLVVDKPKIHFSELISLCSEALDLKSKFNLTDLDLKWMLRTGSEIKAYSCPVCGKQLHVKSMYDGMPKHCSYSCKMKDPDFRTNLKEASLKKYGTEHYFQTDEFKAKAKATNIEKYGVDNPSKSSAIRHKVETTNLKRWGFKVSSKNPEVKEKMFQTNLERYGSKASITADAIKEKAIATTRQHYGVDHPFQSEFIQKKVRDTISKKYSVTCTQKIESIKQKSIQTLKLKHNVTSPLAISYTRLRLIESRHNQSYSTILKRCTDIEPCFKKYEYSGGGYSKTYLWKCKKCGKTFSHYYANGIVPICPYCSPHIPSKYEMELKQYVMSIYLGPISFNTRSIIDPLELDIYIPDKNLAIEFNGDYWHSEDIKGKFYHQEKSLRCASKGIHLIHIWEHDWIIPEKQRIIKSRLKYLLCGDDIPSIGARKCHINVENYKDYSKFFETYHMQGSIKSSVCYSLVYNESTVAMMSFSKPRFSKNHQWELLRYATVDDARIVGGASKLFYHFVKQHNPESVISYADCDWSNIEGSGSVYEKIGMGFSGITEPNYNYIKGSEVLSRYQCQKHKLQDILGEKFNPCLTESENMHQNGYSKVYDSGNAVWEWNNQID